MRESGDLRWRDRGRWERETGAFAFRSRGFVYIRERANGKAGYFRFRRAGRTLARRRERKREIERETVACRGFVLQEANVPVIAR